LLQFIILLTGQDKTNINGETQSILKLSDVNFALCFKKNS